ncbi:uncharacterized protein LOC121376334 [Gigantopelta aegis]|uniref:uncharacterized protein LOC121376334 n=1 Tax=Gigantopelta aegis TaxID=1735272 RepID=UPI001B88BF67|nr:uncharacterized protein LOC121376334 [Gigantopelta aegis]
MDYNSTTDGNYTPEEENFLQKNCRPDWPRWTCTMATICGLISTTIWFIVLLPQVWKNFRRRSVVGVSVLWATANFTASVTNMFFVHIYAKMPIYSQVNAIYMPVLEFIMLLQFWIYGLFPLRSKIWYTVFCCALWSVIIGLQLGLRRFEEMQWLAITLWSVETFPQIILNIKLRSTSGLSTKSIAIAMLGKTTDFIANNVLLLPLQYVIMIYFSSGVAYVNGIQVAWYYDNSKNTGEIHKHKRTTNPDVEDNRISDPFIKNEHCDESSGKNRGENLNEMLDKNFEEKRDIYSDKIRDENQPSVDNVKKEEMSVEDGKFPFSYHICRCIRFPIIIVMILISVVFGAGLIWNTGSWFGLLGPFTIISVLIVSHVYYKTKTSMMTIQTLWMRMSH